MKQADGTEIPGFGDWVRSQRPALWLTQKKLARLIGCAPVTIQKIEEGRRRPSPVLAETLARHLEIAEEQLGPFLHLARTTPTAARTPEPPRRRNLRGSSTTGLWYRPSR